MVFPVIGGDGKPTGYEIDNSLRWNPGDDPKLDIPGISGTLSKAHTFSVWVKRGAVESDRNVIAGMGDGSGNISWIEFHQNKIRYLGDGAGNYFSSTTAVYRDHSAWYHIVVKVDTTQATEANRLKIYVNGTEQAYSGTPPPQNWQTNMDAQIIGFNSGDEFDGYMSEFHFLDGVAYDPTYFGETNDNGVWIPKQYTDGNYGTFGFYLEFKQTGTSQNSSGMGADTSGNDNHFAVTNLAATDVTTDTPTNNFCTMNPLISFAGASDGIDAFTEGNTVVDSNNDTSAAGATFGVQNGKWYYEAKLTTGNQSSTNFATGWASTNYEGQKGTGNGVGFMSGEDNIAVDPGGNLSKNSSSTSVFGNRSTNDIFQVAIDLDNGKIHFGVNGTYSNGSATNSTTLDASNPDYSSVFDTAGEFYMPAFAQGSTGQTVLAYNFGNPAFAISSGNADANGYGNFEYAPPSGYFALCTKNLAEFG